ncbi:MAG: S-layer homology domain-containing protein, partial [Clostridia bacterium]|nr:S-layer homology domain-containing protein [Clostridia bacterium]
MKKFFALILCVASLLAVAVFPASAEEAHEKFTDVEDGKWYTDAIDFVYAASIMTGTSGTCFSPNKPITREEFFFIYVKKNYVWLSNVEIPHYEKMSFTDVPPNKWYSDYIEFAY